MPASVWIINLIVFGVLMEADLGRRGIGWFRVLRPLLGAAAIVPLYLTALPTSGHDVLLQAGGVAAGIAVGLASHLFIRVGFDPRRQRATSRAGWAYALFWVGIFGARLTFGYLSIHVFPVQLGQFLLTHELTGDGLTDALILNALAMTITRSALLWARGTSARRGHAQSQLQQV